MKKVVSTILIIVGLHSLSAQTKIISKGDVWQYYDDKNEPPIGWKRQGAANAANWEAGPSPLGYGDSAIETTIGYGGDSDKKHITKYFRKTFTVEDPYAFLVYELKVQRDDGVVIYLNGREIMRDNMPDGIIKHNTLASSLIVSGKAESIYHRKLVSPDDLNKGTNTLSVSVHKANKISKDCIFNLEFIGNNDAKNIPLLLKERSLKDLNMNLKVQELNSKLELEKKDHQIDILEKMQKSQYTIIIILIIAVFGLLYLIYFNRKKILKSQKDIKELKEIKANKDQELMNSSFSTIRIQQFLKEIKSNLEDSSNEDTNVLKKEVQKVIRQIDYNVEHDEDWLNLSNRFNALHEGYLDRLLYKHTSLTETELRHCMFIKLHMQTKEIAMLMHIDPRSVQAARYRIKKKMNLKENVDLKDYLLNY